MTDYAYTVELHKAGITMTEPFVPDLIIDSLEDLGAGLEDDERGQACCPRLDFSIWATTEAAAFIAAINDAQNICVSVFEYDAQFPTQRYRRFAGRLIELPRRGKSADEDVFIFSATGFLSTYDEVDVVDPVSGGAYRDAYFTDLITALLKAAAHTGGVSIDAGAPIKTADRWTSRLFYPGKHRFGGNYVTTDRITAICNDGANLYIGVGHWLCRYNPATREAVKLARLNYTGKALNLAAWQWRIAHIAYDAGNVVGWAESVYEDLKDNAAHAKISFTYAGGNLIDLADANLIYNYDRDYYVKSRNVVAYNRGGPPPGTDFATWYYKEIGEATPQSNKTLGLSDPGNNWGQIGIDVKIGDTSITEIQGLTIRPHIGDRVSLHQGDTHQDMGEVTGWGRGYGGGLGNTINIGVQYKSRYLFLVGAKVLILAKGYEAPTGNLEIPSYREMKVEYELPSGIGSPTPVDVRVERRRNDDSRSAFYWPEILGYAGKNKTVFVSGPYLALGEGNLPEEYKFAAPNRYYVSEEVPNFYVKMEDAAHFANLPIDGYCVKNKKQPAATGVPGENVLVHNGTPVKISNEGNDVLSTRGNIYLAKEGNTVYVAWNRWRWVEGGWFLQVAWGKLNGDMAMIIGRDRNWTNYQGRLPREITAFAVHDNKFWFGVKRIEPRWRNTTMQIIWASPPHNELKPDDYDGGLIATCLVTYDKTEYLEMGGLIRVRAEGKAEALPKEYLISECEVIPPFEIIDTDHSYRKYPPEVRTRFVLFALDLFNVEVPGNYAEQAKKELADKYVTIMEGWDIRGEICYADGDELKVGHTAVAKYGEPTDGELYDWNQKEWHGESIAPEPDGPAPWTELSEPRVVPGSLTVTQIDSKKEFKVTDKTNLVEGEMPIPPLDEVYVKHREGGEFTETALYFNPAYVGGRRNIFSPEVNITLYMEGQPFDVQYEYYANRVYVEPFVLDGALYFNETETGAIYRRDGDTNWTRVTAWPAPPVKVDVFGDDVYALAENDGALMRYGRTWPGYINPEVGGADSIDIFSALTKIAQAADCFLGEENGRIMLRPRVQSGCIVKAVDFEDFETVQYLEQKKYRGVLFTYANGKAYCGQNDPPDDLILRRSATCVSDYGLAAELARRYYEYFISEAVIYDVGTAREGLTVPMLAGILNVGEINGRLLAYTIQPGGKISMRIEKTVGGRLMIGAIA